jgi:hypothetical protein
MLSSEKDRLVTEAMECWVDFQHSLSSDKRKYPIRQFRAFWEISKRYIDLTKSDPLIHKSIARVVNGLVDFLKLERKRVPRHVLREAERLECLLFGESEPDFEGERPPGPPSSNSLDPPMANCQDAGTLQENESPMALQVQYYAGRSSDQGPVRFHLKDRDFIVEELLDQWYGPDDVFFKVRADDGNLYILRHNLPLDKWSLESFRQTAR